METTAATVFSSSTTRLSDLYGDRGYERVALSGPKLNGDMSANELERKEQSIRSKLDALVKKQAPVPLGVKMYPASLQPQQDKPSGRISLPTPDSLNRTDTAPVNYSSDEDSKTDEGGDEFEQESLLDEDDMDGASMDIDSDAES